MKVIAPIFLLAAAACAQDLSEVPECGRTCVNNMFDKAKDLGCSDDDFKCLCDNADFGNGLRDCTLEACPGGQLEAVQAAASDMCPGNSGGGSPSSSEPSNGDDPTQSPTGPVNPSETGTDGTGAPTATGSGSEPSATGGDNSQSGGSPGSTLSTQPASGTNSGGAPEPTETGGNGGGGGSGGNDDNETGGSGPGSNPTGGSGSGDDSGSGSGGDSATGTAGGEGASPTGAAQALGVHAGGMFGAFGLAAILAL